jgi:RHS repeat-associated protein
VIECQYNALGCRRSLNYSNGIVGNRLQRSVDGTTTDYYYDGEDIILQVKDDGTTSTTTQYVHSPGIDEPLAMIREGTRYFYHADGLGSIVALTDSNKQIVQRYSYDTFGMLTSVQNPEFNNSYAYTAREWDRELGLYYYRARYYDPMEGRFISKDPIGFAGGDVNLYRYVQNDSVNWIDPEGLRTLRCARKLGNRNNPAVRPSGNPFRHDYLVIGEEVYSFQAGGNLFWSEGFLDNDENLSNDQCEVVSNDPNFDNAVKKAVTEIGAPKYNVYAYPLTIPHFLGARNCQTWTDDVLNQAKKIY